MTYKYVDTNLCNHTEQIMEIWAAKRASKQYFPDSALSGKITKDTLQKSADTNAKTATSSDGKDDGKISLKEKVKNFGKGLVAPIKTMFSSPKNMAITAASVIGGAALIAATGGAAAPVMVAAGLIGGGVQIGKGIYKQVNAKTDNEAKQAWQEMGSGTFTVGVSAASAKSSLKAAKVDGAKDMSTMKAVGKCLVDLPKNIKASVKNISSKISAAPIVDTPSDTSTTSAPKSKPASETAAPVEKPIDVTSETTSTETLKPKAKVDVKPEASTDTKVVSNAPAVVSETTVKPKVESEISTELVAKPKTQVKSSGQNVPVKNNQLLLPEPEKRLALPEPPKRLALPEPEKRLLLEAKTDSTPQKIGIVARIKKFLNVFGLFLPKNN